MTRNVHLKKEMVDFITAELAPSGFKYAQQHFYRPVPFGEQLLTLALHGHPDGYEIVPTVSIRHDGIETLYHQLHHQPAPIPSATLGLGYGKLGTDRIISWDLKDPRDIPHVAEDILAHFWKAAGPFFEKFTSLEEIYAILQADTGEADRYVSLADMRAEKALVAAYLLGKQDEYESLIDKKLKYLIDMGNPYLKSFLEFTVAFKRYVKNARP